jgi:hypothetical protein
MIEGIRTLVIEGWNAQALALAFGVSLGLVLVSMWLSARALRVRMART